jgi:hypothetical protein
MATVKFYLKASAKKTDEASILLKFTIDRSNRFALATGERIQSKYWDKRIQQAKSNFNGHVELNQAIGRIKADLIQLYRDNKSAGVSTLQEMARPLVKFGQRQAPEKKSLQDVLTLFINQYEKDKLEGTVKVYRALKTKLLAFNPNLTLDALDVNFYDRFKNWLHDRGLFDAKVYKYFVNLSTVLTWAVKRGYEVHQTKGEPTYKSWEIIKREYDPITLTMADLEKLEALDITEDLVRKKIPLKKQGQQIAKTMQALIVARDCLAIECRTAQRISDLKRFDLKDVEGMVWTNTVRKGSRLNATKTKVPFNTRFTAPAWEILRKYGFKFPEISEQKINKNIKRVCRLAGIDQPVTIYRWKQNEQVAITKDKCDFISTHTGRRTFITIGLQYLKPKLVKDLAGITWKTLERYEGQAEDQVLIDGLNSIPVIQPLLKIAQ